MVDDNREHVLLCQEALLPEEFRVDSAEEGDEALRKLRENFYDIMVIDQGLPDMTGLDLLKKVRERGITVPVLFESATESADLSVKALKAGACDFMVKTFRYYANLRTRLLENIEACSLRGH
jgi:two-component system alkaline phosphatase synthesis response regulator PhoP